MQRLRFYPFLALGVLAAASVAEAQGTNAPVSVRLEAVGGTGVSGTAELRQREGEPEFGSPHVLEVRVEDRDDVVACGAIRG